MPTCINLYKRSVYLLFFKWEHGADTRSKKNPNMGETIRKSRVVGREAFTPEATAHKAAIIPHFVYFNVFLIN